MRYAGIATAFAALLLSGCGSFFGTEDDGPPLPGKRVAVLAQDRGVKPDPRAAALTVTLPSPQRNADWPQAGGVPSHSLQHLAAGGKLARLWRSDIGTSSGSDGQLLSQPITDGKRVYTMDVEADVRAYDLNTGDRLWRADLEPDEDDDGTLGGGLAIAKGRVYVTTGFAFVIALDAATGKEIWRQRLDAPMRAAPTVFGDRVFVITVANELIALNADTGKRLWTHSGIVEAAGLMGAAPPAVVGGVVVAPFSSGEVVAVRMENGRVLWTEALAALDRSNPITSIAHIRAPPVIDRDRVFVVSHSNRMVSINLRTGSRLWERPIGGVNAPWVAGEFLYVLSRENQLICLTRADGRVRWVTPLPRYEDEEDKEDPISWTGPVLAGGRLVIASSTEDLWLVSPYTGKIIEKRKAPGEVLIPPAVARETLLLLTEDADLVAYR